MRAEIGDKGKFILLNKESIFGAILYIPSCPGDSWIVREYHEGKKAGVGYIQTYACMYLIEKQHV